eukprot:TRINITY_DN3412_c0_g1_i1.p1 TRINITY_DN3412_c0_g1~~TRINITY_DN3412_c0_g1_i1.p1  ORF type:complete len:269 (+),score=12.86 TRINITY_DN3412_c0_g1_i1:313-1119(+)
MAYKVHTYTGASMHDHTFGFKVDLDVGSHINSFQKIEYRMAPTLDALNSQRSDRGEALETQKPPYLQFNKMRYYTLNTVGTENDALLSIDPSKPTTWIFGDTQSTNRWGNMKAYKLSLDQTPSVIVDSDHRSMPAYSYSKQMLSVTKHSDLEQTLTGPYDLNRLDNPQGSFENFVNNESIVQQDLVAWVSLTTLHLPTAEDVPITSAIVHGFTLQPWNFFDENPSMDMPHYLRMYHAEEPGDMRKEDMPAVPSCIPKRFDTTHTFSGV